MNYSFRNLALYMSKRSPYLVIRKVIEMLFGLVTFAILVRMLTKEQFAIYSLIFGFIAIVRLTALPGLGTAVSQAFARSLPGGFGRAVKLSLQGSFIGSIIILGSAWWHFNLEDSATGEALFVTALCFPLVVGLTFWRNAAAGAEQYGRLLCFDSLSAALKSASVILCAYFYPGVLYPVVIAALVAPALINIVATIVQFSSLPSDAEREPDSIEYGIRTTIYQLPSVLAQQLDKFVLFYFISPEALAIYTVALRIPELARAVVGETIATLGPVFAREPNYSRTLHYFSLKLWLFYGVLSIIGALFIVPYLLPILTGNNYMEAVPYAQFMTVGVALGYLGSIQFRYVKSHLHGRSFLVVTMATAICNCLLILGLAYYFELAGVVVAYVLKNLCHSVITNAVIKFKYLKVRTSPATN